jgi:hypothetical protein
VLSRLGQSLGEVGVSSLEEVLAFVSKQGQFKNFVRLQKSFILPLLGFILQRFKTSLFLVRVARAWVHFHILLTH